MEHDTIKTDIIRCYLVTNSTALKLSYKNIHIVVQKQLDSLFLEFYFWLKFQ